MFGEGRSESPRVPSPWSYRSLSSSNPASRGSSSPLAQPPPSASISSSNSRATQPNEEAHFVQSDKSTYASQDGRSQQQPPRESPDDSDSASGSGSGSDSGSDSDSDGEDGFFSLDLDLDINSMNQKQTDSTKSRPQKAPPRRKGGSFSSQLQQSSSSTPSHTHSHSPKSHPNFNLKSKLIQISDSNPQPISVSTSTSPPIQPLAPEPDRRGNLEYKLWLLPPTRDRFNKLLTQAKWRMLQGGGIAVYEIGVLDDGTLVGLTRWEMRDSLNCLSQIAKELKGRVEISRVIEVEFQKDQDRSHHGILREEEEAYDTTSRNRSPEDRIRNHLDNLEDESGHDNSSFVAQDRSSKSNGNRNTRYRSKNSEIIGLRNLDRNEAHSFLGDSVVGNDFSFQLIDEDATDDATRLQIETNQDGKKTQIPKLIPTNPSLNSDRPARTSGSQERRSAQETVSTSLKSSSTEDSSFSPGSDSTFTGDDSKDSHMTPSLDRQDQDGEIAKQEVSDEEESGKESSEDEGGFGFGFSLSLSDDEVGETQQKASQVKRDGERRKKKRSTSSSSSSSSSTSSLRIPLPAGLMVTNSPDSGNPSFVPGKDDNQLQDGNVGMGPSYILDPQNSTLEVHPPPHLFAKRLKEEEDHIKTFSRNSTHDRGDGSSRGNASTSTLGSASASGISSSDGPETPRDTPSRSSTPIKALEVVDSRDGDSLSSKPGVQVHTSSDLPSPFDSASSFLSAFDLDGLITSKSKSNKKASSKGKGPNLKALKEKNCRKKVHIERRARRLAELRVAERAGAGLMPEITLEIGRLSKSLFKEDWEWAVNGGQEGAESQVKGFERTAQPLEISKTKSSSQGIGKENQVSDELKNRFGSSSPPFSGNKPRSWLRELAELKIFTPEDLRNLGHAYLANEAQANLTKENQNDSLHHTFQRQSSSAPYSSFSNNQEGTRPNFEDHQSSHSTLGSSARRTRNSKIKLNTCTCSLNSEISQTDQKERKHSEDCVITLEEKKMKSRRDKRDRKRENKRIRDAGGGPSIQKEDESRSDSDPQETAGTRAGGKSKAAETDSSNLDSGGSSRKKWNRTKNLKSKGADQNFVLDVADQQQGKCSHLNGLDFATAPSEAILATYQSRNEDSPSETNKDFNPNSISSSSCFSSSSSVPSLTSTDASTSNSKHPVAVHAPQSSLRALSADERAESIVHQTTNPSHYNKTIYGESRENKRRALENHHLFVEEMRVIVECVLRRDGKNGKAFTHFEESFN